MLKKIMTIALVLALVVVFGCGKKTEQPAPPQPSVTEQAKQTAETAGKEVKKETQAAKEKAGEQLEKAGKALKDANTE